MGLDCRRSENNKGGTIVRQNPDSISKIFFLVDVVKDWCRRYHGCDQRQETVEKVRRHSSPRISVNFAIVLACDVCCSGESSRGPKGSLTGLSGSQDRRQRDGWWICKKSEKKKLFLDQNQLVLWNILSNTHRSSLSILEEDSGTKPLQDVHK